MIQKRYQKGMLLIFFCIAQWFFPADLMALQQSEVLDKNRNVFIADIEDQFYKTDFDKKIDVAFEETDLEDALKVIANKSGLKLTFRGDVMVNKKITLRDGNISVSDALKTLLEGTSLDYRFSSQRHLIIQRRMLTETEITAEVITGIVTDEQSGKALPGVNILVKGTNIGASTNADGEFSLDAPSLTDTLVVSFIGYEKREIPIEGRTNIEISLIPETVTGDEMVVVGYGEQREISLIGSQSSIDDVQEIAQPSASLTTTLAGRLSGVVGVQRSGQPGENAADIWIRGVSTFGGSDSNPLILVDGVERPMNSLNPQDIENITVLKDASATAVYGTRGANGVILVETKEGVEGEPSVDVGFYQGMTTLTKMPDLADGLTYMQLANEARTTRGESPLFSEEEIENTRSGTNPLLYPNVDWMDTIFKNYGQNRQANVNVSGGSSTAQYRVSLSYYNESGLFVNSDRTDYNTNSQFSKYNALANVNLEVTSSTTLDLGIRGILRDARYPGAAGNNPDNAIFSAAMDVPPVEYPIMYPGDRVPGQNANGNKRNPYVDVTQRGYTDLREIELFSNLELTQELDFLTEGLSVRGLFSFDTFNSNRIDRWKRLNTYFIDPTNPRNPDGSYRYNLTFEGQPYLGYGSINAGNRKYYMEAAINYDRTFRESHDVTGLLLYNQSDFSNSFAGGFTGSLPERTQGASFRGTYSYDDRYFFEVNFGYTGSEDFAPENRYGLFPSAGVGWVLSNENFFEPLTNIFQYFKIRYSDGFVGAGEGGGRRFAYLTVLSQNAPGYTYGINRDNGYSGINVTDYGTNVGWAESRKQDLGIEFRTFQDKLSVTFDVFKEHRDGIFLQRSSIPSFVGLENNPWGNLGVVENKGFDGSIEFNASINQDWSLGFRTNFSYNRDEILENDQAPQPYPWMDRRGDNILAQYGYIAEGLFESQEEINNHASQFGNVMPGDIKYKDLNDDGVINSFDQKKIGSGDVPYLTFGFALNSAFKAFDLGAFFQGQVGADRQISGTSIQPFWGDGGIGNLYQTATDRWTEENPDPDAMYPRLAYGRAQNTNNHKVSSYWQRDIDFVRLKTLEVGYSLPASITGRVGMTNARFYARGLNLLTFSNFGLWDPELNTSNGGVYPNNRVYSIGFNLNF
jgi:TonB-linked SusC/RagA family outer membrane protein